MSSNDLSFERAKEVIPGGVNSPVRAFGSVGGVPKTIVRSEGSRIFDVDGQLIAGPGLIVSVLPSLFETMGGIGIFVSFAFFLLMDSDFATIFTPKFPEKPSIDPKM